MDRRHFITGATLFSVSIAGCTSQDKEGDANTGEQNSDDSDSSDDIENEQSGDDSPGEKSGQSGDEGTDVDMNDPEAVTEAFLKAYFAADFDTLSKVAHPDVDVAGNREAVQKEAERATLLEVEAELIEIDESEAVVRTKEVIEYEDGVVNETEYKTFIREFEGEWSWFADLIDG